MNQNKQQIDAIQEILDLLPGFVYQLKMTPDGKFSYLYISEGVERILGIPVEKVLEDAENLMNLIHDEDIDRVIAESMKQLDKVQPWFGEFRMFSVDGRMMYFEAHDSPKLLEDGNVIWAGFANNVTEKRELEQRINALAKQDSLTGAPNRIAFYEILENTIHLSKRKKTRFALMFVDLDKFKPVNDTYGHQVGDLLLQAVTKRIRTALRSSDTCYRFGGDEFLVLLPEISTVDSTKKIAEKIIQSIAQPYELAGHSITISASIGISIYPDHGNEADVLINHADTSMYDAKKQGSGLWTLYQPEA